MDKAVLAPQEHKLCGPKRSLHSALPIAVNSNIPLGEMRYGAEMGPTIITTAIAVLLGSIKTDSCLYFNYTGKNQPIAQNINSSLPIYRNSRAWCNCASPNISCSTGVPVALPSEIFAGIARGEEHPGPFMKASRKGGRGSINSGRTVRGDGLTIFLVVGKLGYAPVEATHSISVDFLMYFNTCTGK